MLGSKRCVRDRVARLQRYMRCWKGDQERVEKLLRIAQRVIHGSNDGTLSWANEGFGDVHVALFDCYIAR